MHIFSFKANPPQDINLTFKPRAKEYEKYLVKMQRQYSTDPKVECKQSGPNIQQKSTQSFQQLYKQCSSQFQEQGLNIINRQRFYGANYTQFDRTNEFYSLRDIDQMRDIRQNGLDLQYPDLRVLDGYESSVTYAKRDCVIKTESRRRLITKDSVHDFIRKYGVQAVSQWIKGKRAITTYSHQIIKMDGLDPSLNLDKTFMKDGNPISYKEYYSKKKDLYGNLIKLREQHEEALVINHFYIGPPHNRRIKNTSHFLPQLLYVIVPHELQNEGTRAQMRKESHPSVANEVGKAMRINQQLAMLNKNALFQTEEECIKVKGWYLTPPKICFFGM